jgi:hypothetical protein
VWTRTRKNKRVGVRGGAAKEAVVSLIERDGRVRSHHVANVSAKTLRPISPPKSMRRPTS